MTEYIGRFAPSPTGPLHLGSLLTAVASYLQARARNGVWLVRIEDIDPPREAAGAIEEILQTLDAHGFQYSDPLLQSTRLSAYADAIDTLLASDQVYLCSCTRQTLRTAGLPGLMGPIYSGTCRKGPQESAGTSMALRFRTNDQPLEFIDLLQGKQVCRMESEIGDFLIRRRDGLVSYQLAVAIDDAFQGITEVLRGTDLLNSTFAQIAVLRALTLPEPDYCHVPVVVKTDGTKLSKQTGAQPLDLEKAEKNILKCLFLLGQKPPDDLADGTLDDIWNWAVTNWNPQILAGRRSVHERSII